MNTELQKQYADVLRNAVSETMKPRPPPFGRDLHKGVLDALEPLIHEIAALKAASETDVSNTVYTSSPITISGHLFWRVVGPMPCSAITRLFKDEQAAKDAAHLANMAYKAGWDDAQKRAAQHKDIVSVS